MWRTYSDISDTWFKNATKIIDKYHWIEQKKLSPQLRKYFKLSKSLLNKRFDSLNDEQKQQVNVMLYYSVNISRAYFYKEDFLNIIKSKNPEASVIAFNEWIESAKQCELEPFEKCARTMNNWHSSIINSFSSTITNGFIEGCNNKIKVLKRTAYGYQNFKRFRNRILHMFSHQHPTKKQAFA